MALSLNTRQAAVVAVTVASVLALAACAPGKGSAEDFRGIPIGHAVEAPSKTGAETGSEGKPFGAWLRDGQQIAVTTYGSSSCPTVGDRIAVTKSADEGNSVEVYLKAQPQDQPCTADFGPHTTVFWTPMDVTTTKPLHVKLGNDEFIIPVK